MISRRNLIGGSAILAGAAAVSGRVQAAGIPEAVIATSPAMQPPLFPSSGPDYQPVVTLNGWTLPWRMNGDWKEFHLVAEPVVREIAPGMKAHLWGYNGQSPGPTIECVEGDKVRIFVTNKLPEHTTVHWHGMLVPNGMDGVGGLTQPHIKPGQDLRLRVRDEEERHLHVPPARRRNGADGDGDDGLFRRAPARPQAAPGRSRLRLSHEHLRHRPRQLPAEGHDHDRLQSVDLEQPRVSRHRSAGGAARRPRAGAHRQSHHDQPSDPHARPPISR